jgi:hypothetical protein
MENLIIASLLYIVIIGVAFSGKQPRKTKRQPKQRPVKPQSFMDISCVFESAPLGSIKVTPKAPKVNPPAPVGLSSMTVQELRVLAKKKNVSKPYKLRKAELIEVLQAA